jgi:hypothetical protein
MAATDLWPTPVATGLGPLPGTDPFEAAAIVLGELPDFPHVPQLPERGAGADPVGRTVALLADFHVDLQPSGWRFVDAPGIDERRARDFLARDLDAFQEHAAGYEGPVKVQALGPWSLATGVELQRGNKALADRGAVRDLAQALAEGMAAHAADLRHRVPGSTVVVQFDEPALAEVLDGRVPTASGFGRLAPVEAVDAEEHLRAVIAAPDAPAGVWCPAPRLPVLQAAGAAFAAMSAAAFDQADEDELGEAIEAGVALMVGLVPVTVGRPWSTRDAVDRLKRTLGRIGLAPPLAVSPAAGLAATSPEHVVEVLGRCRVAAEALAEEPVEES